MADEQDKPSAQPAPASRGRRRPAPTIDLKATEVSDAGSPADPPTAPPADTAAAPAFAAETAGHTATDTRESEAADTSPPSAPHFAVPWSLLGAAVGGGAVALIATLLLWGMLAGNQDTGQQVVRIATLEANVRDLAAREMPAATDPRTVAAVAERVAKLEAAGSAPRTPPIDPALVDRLAAVEQRIGALTDENAALKRSNETAQTAGAQGQAVDRQEIATLTDRLTALERAAQALQAELTQQRSNLAQQREARADERAMRLAIIAETLKAAVARGERFRAELDAAKALTPDAAVLSSLDPFVDTGVPTVAALAQQLRAALPAMRRAVAPKATADGGFLQRLQANAERLVRIQPAGEQAGDDAGAILARAEAKANRRDIAGAAAELATLPPEVRVPAEDWIKTAQAREAAIEASRRFAAAQIGALAGRPD